MVHDDAVAISEFQEFAIDTGIQTISIFARSALTPRVYEVFCAFRLGCCKICNARPLPQVRKRFR